MRSSSVPDVIKVSVPVSYECLWVWQRLPKRSTFQVLHSRASSWPRWGSKGLPRTNILAYYKLSLITDVKTFIALGSGNSTFSAVVGNCDINFLQFQFQTWIRKVPNKKMNWRLKSGKETKQKLFIIDLNEIGRNWTKFNEIQRNAAEVSQ